MRMLRLEGYGDGHQWNRENRREIETCPSGTITNEEQAGNEA
jgi:hypothetical protein